MSIAAEEEFTKRRAIGRIVGATLDRTAAAVRRYGMGALCMNWS